MPALPRPILAADAENAIAANPDRCGPQKWPHTLCGQNWQQNGTAYNAAGQHTPECAFCRQAREGMAVQAAAQTAADDLAEARL